MLADMDRETEPLISSESRAAQDDLKQDSKSSWYLFILTFGMGGLQVIWSVQHANGSPYLLSLGMSKALLACVWIAGPLTGSIVQPYVGVLSDNCRSRWGRRRPFIVMGGVITVICLLILAWVRELAGGLLRMFGANANPESVKTVSIVAATVLMYFLDFAVNTIQAGMRAFIVDNAPWHQQKLANAWASRVNQAASIISYAFGYMDLPSLFPILGKTQFQVLSVLSTFALTVCLSISCLFIKETYDYQKKNTAGLKNISPLSMIWKSARHVSPQIKKVFAIQFASWFGWFSFLFYVTTYIGQLYVNPIFDKNRNLSESEIEKAWEEATRLATSAFFVNAVVSFAGSIVLPLLVTTTPEEETDKAYQSIETSSDDPRQESRLTILTTSLRLLYKLWAPGLTLRRLWLLSHFLFAACMFSTVLISSPRVASVMAAIVGIPWVVTSWAPFAIIATELTRKDAVRRRTRQAEDGVATQSSSERDEDYGEAGVILGLHNVFISSPQIVSSIVGSVVFKALQKPRGEPFDDSVAWVMRIGGCAALVAGLLTIPLQEQVA